MAMGGSYLFKKVVRVDSSMPTAIARGFSSAGFVIAADGRSCDQRYAVLSDEAQKIFQISQNAAYYTRGVSKLGDRREEQLNTVYFDLVSEFSDQVRRTRLELYSSLLEYGRAVSGPVNQKLLSAVENNPHIHLPSNSLVGDFGKWRIIDFFLDAFIGGRPERIAITFWHQDGTPREPEIKEEALSIGLDFFGPSVMGRFRTDQAYRRRIEIEIPSTLQHENLDLASMIREAYGSIKGCSTPEAQKEDIDCRGVGGRIHIATLTADRGFQWVPGCEPTLSTLI